MAGRTKAGVDGIESLISWGGALLLFGVSNVRPRLLGFRFCGVGGLTKDGDASGICSSSGKGRLDVEDVARPETREVFTASPFRFRPFRGGCCFCSSKNGRVSSEVLGRSIPEEGGGDSGDDPGEVSVALESSTVDTVVVGDESVEPVAVSLRR